MHWPQGDTQIAAAIEDDHRLCLCRILAVHVAVPITADAHGKRLTRAIGPRETEQAILAAAIGLGGQPILGTRLGRTRAADGIMPMRVQGRRGFCQSIETVGRSICRLVVRRLALQDWHHVAGHARRSNN